MTDLLGPRSGEITERLHVRFRTVGDMSCTCPVESRAATISDVLIEVEGARSSERGATRADDASEASMELRKLAGYF